MLYAIVDIETTGGFAQGAGISEIAIVVTDGETIIEKYETLINPGHPIPYFITRLTGITDKMVENAPPFEAVAENIYEILKDKIFVAHNVQFDYSFVNNQLSKLNYFLNSKKLCTVKYGKKVITGLKSYSLGNFCNALEIPIENRHRAMGDCYATYLLLKEIFKNDRTNILYDFLKHHTPYKNIPLQLNVDDYQKIPSAIGVYYFLDVKQKIIYIGKAINLKKRISQHFTGNKTTKQRQDFVREIAYIKFEMVATELMSLILESTEIKKYWPKYNIAQKHGDAKYAIYVYEDQSGYTRLCVDKKKKQLPAICDVKNKIEGLITLRKMVENYNLCPEKCMVSYIAEHTVHADCKGTCLQFKTVNSYNKQVTKALKEHTALSDSYLIIDNGMSDKEVSVVAVYQNNFVAMGYIAKNKTNKYKYSVYTQLPALSTNNYINAIVNYYAQKWPEKLIFPK